VEFIHQEQKKKRELTYLTLSIHTNDSTRGFMRSSNKNGVRTDSIHVNTLSTFQIVEVNVPILGNQVNNVILVASLKGNEQIIFNPITLTRL